jgi:hypothetical protein
MNYILSVVASHNDYDTAAIIMLPLLNNYSNIILSAIPRSTEWSLLLKFSNHISVHIYCLFYE